jgi:hypothetical protein
VAPTRLVARIAAKVPRRQITDAIVVLPAQSNCGAEILTDDTR